MSRAVIQVPTRTTGSEEALEAAGYVTAVLEGKAQVTLGGKSVGPGEEALVAPLCSGHGQLAGGLSRHVFDRAAV